MDQLWHRVLQGQHTALIGLAAGDPPTSADLGLLRISCDVPPTTLGPLLEARSKVERVLDIDAPLLDQARQRLAVGLRQKLLGDLPARAEEGTLVELWNRLSQRSPRRYAIVFEALDAADEPTLEVLRRILRRAGWLKLPLVLEFRKTELTPSARALLDALTASHGPDAVIQAPAREGPASLRQEIALSALPPDVLRVLRVGAVMGSGFEAELCAALLGADTLLVLDALQRAADAGVPIDDRGEGRFHLPEALVTKLRTSTLPSLLLLLHRRLAAILTVGSSQPETARAPLPQEEPKAEPSPAADLPPVSLQETDRSGPWPYAEIFSPAEGSAPTVPAPEPPAMAPEPPAPATEPAAAAAYAPPAVAEEPPAAAEEPPAPEPPAIRTAPSAPRGDLSNDFIGYKEASIPPPKDAEPRSPFSHRGDDARAAGHLAAAGEIEASAERYLIAAQHAASLGATAQAIAHGNKALSLLDGLPDSRKRRLLRVAVLLEFGRLQWQSAGPDSTYTLAGALDVLTRARDGLKPGDPPELMAFAGSLVAGVCYDIGDMPSLERALEELTVVSRILLAEGDATGAARLLNDQAAIYIRMGDPVRATHLLGESRKIFESRAAEDPVAMLEMAETDHLFARIPLHVAARPGREDDALSMGLDHAIAAERTYRRLGGDREVARVWETMGRLELKKGRIDRAMKRLSSAASAQQRIGDLIGLARSTAALSEVLAATGRYREAATLLGESVAFNFDKGSPIGLAFNRRAFDALVMRAADDRDASVALEEVRERLESAESLLGQLSLPGEAA